MTEPREHQRICFVSGPGTGKSTLAQGVTVELKLRGFDAEYCPEFARAYLRRSGQLVTPFEQFVIFAGACEREDELAVHQFVVCDSASFLSEVYFKYIENIDPKMLAGQRIKFERGLHEMSRMCRTRLRKFDQIFFVPHGHFDVPPDPTRIYGDQEVLSNKIRAYLDNNDVRYQALEGVTLKERVDEVMSSLDEHKALENPVLPSEDDRVASLESGS